MKSADDELRTALGRPDTTSERSLAEVARDLVTGSTMSRRQVLRWIGGALAGAVVARFPGSAFAVTTSDQTEPAGAAPHGERLRGIALTTKDRSLEGRFGLMFKNLPAFEPPDALLTGLATSMEEPQDAPPSVTDNPSVPAGFVLLGQFIDHDLTFDKTPLHLQREDPHALTNFSSTRFDLDSVYGKDPIGSPELYNPNDPAKLRLTGLGDPKQPDDLPRRDDGTAIIADPRDDTNLITCQLHIAFRKFHNALVDHVRAQGRYRADEVFGVAQGLCRWHYQWMVVHDFLPRVVPQEVINEILQERLGGPAQVTLNFYKPKNPNKPMMPIEFAVAAYRFGHSMVRPTYVINEQGNEAVLFGKEPTKFNLNGRRPIPPRLEIAWRHFFDIPGVAGPPANVTRRIDGDLSTPLFTLPASIVPSPDTRKSLAERNLLRGKMLGLPSGQQVARKMGVEALSNEDLKLGNEPGWEGQAPLWFYILKEAEIQHQGKRLGDVGGRIVAEVFLGLLKLDGSSYLNEDPIFRPKPPIAREDGSFGMGDLLKFAGGA
jgi:hypothetical protein